MSSQNDVAVQIGTQITTNRRVNIDFLANFKGSQEALARAIPGAGLTQQMISEIVNKKRPLSEYEARKAESDLQIPHGWIDRIKLSNALQLWLRFKEIGPEEMALFNEMQSFFDVHATPPMPKRAQRDTGAA